LPSSQGNEAFIANDDDKFLSKNLTGPTLTLHQMNLNDSEVEHPLSAAGLNDKSAVEGKENTTYLSPHRS